MYFIEITTITVKLLRLDGNGNIIGKLAIELIRIKHNQALNKIGFKS